MICSVRYKPKILSRCPNRACKISKHRAAGKLKELNNMNKTYKSPQIGAPEFGIHDEDYFVDEKSIDTLDGLSKLLGSASVYDFLLSHIDGFHIQIQECLLRHRWRVTQPDSSSQIDPKAHIELKQISTKARFLESNLNEIKAKLRSDRSEVPYTEMVNLLHAQKGFLQELEALTRET